MPGERQLFPPSTMKCLTGSRHTPTGPIPWPGRRAAGTTSRSSNAGRNTLIASMGRICSIRCSIRKKIRPPCGAGLCGQSGQARYARLHSPFRGGRQVAVQQLRRGDDGEDLLNISYNGFCGQRSLCPHFLRRCACSFPENMVKFGYCKPILPVQCVRRLRLKKSRFSGKSNLGNETQ